MAQFAAIYLNGVDAEMPLASPLFADLCGLPPLLVHVGTAELGLHEARLFNRTRTRCRRRRHLGSLAGHGARLARLRRFACRKPPPQLSGSARIFRDRFDQEPLTTDPR